MSFKEKLNVKRTVLWLLCIVIATYGLGSLIIYGSNWSWKSGTKMNYSVDDAASSNLEGVKEINVNVDSAAINVIPDGENVVKAHLSGSTSSKSSKDRIKLQCYKSGSTLIIKAENTNHMSIGFYRSDLKLDVHVPASYNSNIKLVSSSGDISMKDFKLNELYCKLSSGNLNMSNISTERFVYDSSSGDLKADGLNTKTTSLKSSSGVQNISKFSGELKSSSSSGDTKVEYAAFDSNMDIHSSSGTIEVKLPKTAEFQLDATCSSGDVTCDFPIMVTGKKKDHELQGVVGRDKNKIKLDASSGDIKVLN